MKLFKEILVELKSIFGGKTIDAILPPLIFIILNSVFNLLIGAVASIVIGIVLFLIRLKNKQAISYAIVGLLGIVISVGFALLASNASNFFLPDIISNGFILALTLGSLIIDKPIAAYVSHLTRGWSLAWFFRKDVKPAYREVSYLWLIFFLLRSIIQINLYLTNNVNALGIASFLTGLPATIFILTLSYIYGMWRLQNLKGPSVDEFNQNKQPPYQGQKKGF